MLSFSSFIMIELFLVLGLFWIDKTSINLARGIYLGKGNQEFKAFN